MIKEDSTKHESARALCASVNLVEGYDPKTGEFTMTVIEAGFNKAKSRYYQPQALKRDHKVFNGVKMFADHATDSEQKARPEGSVRNWVAQVKETWAESDARVRGRGVVIDPQFKAKLDTLAEKGLLNEMGVSIRAIGEAPHAKIDGVDTRVVESLLACRSVDFVTYAGAGGRVEIMEGAEAEQDVDLITEAQLRQRRPDLVELIESTNKKEHDMSEELKQQLQEAQAQLTTQTATAVAEKARADTAEAKLQEADKKQKQTAAAAELTKLLTESKLPEKAQTRLKKQFAEALDVTGMKEAVTEELEYIKSIAPTSTKVKNMGSKTQETTESDAEKEKATALHLVESFKASGLTEEQAKIAAAGRR